MQGMDMLSPEQTTTFTQQGILRLERAIHHQLTSRAKAWILSELDRHNLTSGKGPQSSKIRALPIFQQTTRLGELIKTNSSITELFTPDLFVTIQSIRTPNSQGIESFTPSQVQLLLSLPHQQKWSLKQLNWHLDKKIPERDEIRAIQAFVLIDDLPPKGGATLAFAGSHRLPYLSGKPNALHLLRQSQEFQSLFEGHADPTEAYFRPQKIEGIEVRIVEMSGKAGDVYLMDMRVLHTPSINSSSKIRMMATSRFF